jgi:hypothetical protein
MTARQMTIGDLCEYIEDLDNEIDKLVDVWSAIDTTENDRKELEEEILELLRDRLTVRSVLEREIRNKESL